ncbi:MAG: hypothetical protein VX294_01150 [Candidatus Latescibacterota bacterium]|nr:hypothetical protein [Candidatus Latescibacterota bacterium]
MSRGKKVVFSGIALFGICSIFAYASPVSAQTVSSTAAAGVDNIAPDAVGSVSVEVDLGVPNVTILWTLPADDFSRQIPSGSDFGTGGVFVSGNDVASYNVYRTATGGESEVVAELSSGVTSFVDDTVEAGLSYTYSVTAEDAGGNESEGVETDLVSLGPPPSGGKPEVPEGAEVTKVATVQLGGELPPEEEQAEFIADIRQVLADLLGIDISRVIVKELRAGSIIIDFEIVEDEEDEVSAEELVADLTEALDENPDAFSEVEGAGAVEAVVIKNAVSVDFGAVAMDGDESEEFRFVNSADDADAILSVSAEVSGDGYSVSPANFNLAVGEEGSFDVSFDASEVDNLNGDYPGVLQIRTNDPKQRLTTVALSAEITDGYDLAEVAVSGAVPANFGAVLVGLTKTLEVNIANKGDLSLTGTIAVEGDAFTADIAEFALEGGEDVDVSVAFEPIVFEPYEGSLTISSDGINPEVVVDLSGTGRDPEDVQILQDDEGNEILGDIDGSAVVDYDDFFRFADNFGSDSPDPAADLDQDSDVDYDDFFIFADNFGREGTYVSL